MAPEIAGCVKPAPIGMVAARFGQAPDRNGTMKTMSCQPIRRLRSADRVSLLILGLVLAAYLGLATHTALHSPVAGEADCVYCGYGDRPDVAQSVVTLGVDAVSEARPSAAPANLLLAYPGYRCPARGPPLTS